MEIEEMKQLWTEMSTQLEQQKKLTDKTILQMTQINYNNRIQKIAKYESIGAVICFGAALFILFNIAKLDAWYLLLSGLLTAAVLIFLPVMVLRSIQRMKQIRIAENQYAENVRIYTKARNNFLYLQRIGIFLSFILVITSLPVAGKLLKNKDFILESEALWWYIPIMLVGLLLFARWGYRCYKGITASAEDILKDADIKP